MKPEGEPKVAEGENFGRTAANLLKLVLIVSADQVDIPTSFHAFDEAETARVGRALYPKEDV